MVEQFCGSTGEMPQGLYAPQITALGDYVPLPWNVHWEGFEGYNNNNMLIDMWDRLLNCNPWLGRRNQPLGVAQLQSGNPQYFLVSDLQRVYIGVIGPADEATTWNGDFGDTRFGHYGWFGFEYNGYLEAPKMIENNNQIFETDYGMVATGCRIFPREGVIIQAITYQRATGTLVSEAGP